MKENVINRKFRAFECWIWNSFHLCGRIFLTFARVPHVCDNVKKILQAYMGKKFHIQRQTIRYPLLILPSIDFSIVYNINTYIESIQFIVCICNWTFESIVYLFYYRKLWLGGVPEREWSCSSPPVMLQTGIIHISTTAAWFSVC